jgi:hypothetical protein
MFNSLSLSPDGVFYLAALLIAVPVAAIAVYVDKWFMRLGHVKRPNVRTRLLSYGKDSMHSTVEVIRWCSSSFATGFVVGGMMVYQFLLTMINNRRR